ncbi:MAG TPA: polyribonucleotide nucleotidyltransferase [Patescibacteria group bacterium]|nr:polyribonucleotide nucleotidyltransferase [Patescibacteria group bacterium]
MKKIEKTFELAGKKLTLTTGHVAAQATGAVMAQYGETVVLATVVSAPLKQQLDYFPLSVEYQEKLYAGGRIKGSRWVKREGRPTDEEILSGRLIDRSIRPLFPKEYKKDVQVILTVLSVDMENSPAITAAIAVSAALSLSSIPWMGPVSILRVGLDGDKYVINPTNGQMEASPLDLIVSSTKDAVVMIEAGGNEVPEEKIIAGITEAKKEGDKLIKFISDFADSVGTKKEVLPKEEKNESVIKKVKKLADDTLKDLVSKMATKEADYATFDEAKKAVMAEFEGDEVLLAGEVFEKLYKDEVRKLILSGKRADGRKHDELRELSAMVSVLPRTHGSAIFSRGQTQALSIATIGAPSLGQTIESAEGEETKRYMHHYSMPPFSTGETGRIGSPSRREIGHGALAERALLPVIPSEDEFPYAIRVATEVLSSNGSTSMASACGSSLSLMDAGVPIKSPVGGIAMGVVIEDEKNYAILTDIVGIEDGNGDMDFKVAGTKDGITALQLDVKTLKLSVDILEKAIAQAKTAREKILAVMTKAISAPREKVSKYAPKIKIIKIDVSKIGELIGPGGKIIKGLIASTGSQIDVDDDGKVFISAVDEASVDKAVEAVNNLFREPVAGEVYEGVVRRIQPFGAFIEIFPGKEGMVHVSDMSEDYVSNPSDIVKIDDVVKVRVKEIDELGRVNLSMLLDGDKPKAPRRESGGFERRYDDRGSRGGGMSRDRRPRRDNYSRNDRRDRSGGRSGGPHFPTSRFIEESRKKYDR